MANRSALYKQQSEKSNVVYGATLYEAALLPFERQLCESIGISEKEYRSFVGEVKRRGKIRPAGYELIPEITAGPLVAAGGGLTVLGQLVVGVSLTAISMLLAPKPKQGKPVDRRTLDSITGRDRFSPTSGFESQAELATYGAPIPIIFGRYTGTEGGLFISPPLVWSRMFSYGSQQGVKLLFVVGEQGYDDPTTRDGILKPELEGIFLGNGNLNAIFDHTFAFYWKRNTTRSNYSRIRAVNFHYGSRGSVDSGDPETNDDIFMAPVKGGFDEAFCSSHSLTNNAEFGCYQPVFNGTVYKLPWRVVSMPADSTKKQTSFERLKIAGDSNGSSGFGAGADHKEFGPKLRDLGMKGTGRGYCRGIGLTHLNGAIAVSSNDPGFEEKQVNVGDKVTFTISGVNIRQNLYGAEDDQERVKIDDINSSTESARLAADDTLQLGETFVIGRSVFKVIQRDGPWEPPSDHNNEDQSPVEIILECIESPVNGFEAKVGFVHFDVINPPNRGYFIDTDPVADEDTQEATWAPGSNFYPLLRLSQGIVRNTRACDVTEVGIRSKVFQRITNVCNFQSIPQPQELINLDNEDIQVTSGTNTSYIKRTSFFSVQIRRVQSGDNTWHDLGKLFAVLGNQPVDQYNSIRFDHPQRAVYEYRFVPRSGANVKDLPNDSSVVLLEYAPITSGGVINQVSEEINTPEGTFAYTAKGKKMIIKELQRNKEFLNGASMTVTRPAGRFPTRVEVAYRLPNHSISDREITAVHRTGLYSLPTGATTGVMGAFCYELFGAATVASASTRTSSIEKADISDNRWIRLQYVATKVALASNDPSGEDYGYTITETKVLESSGNLDWGVGITVIKDLGGSNPFKDTGTTTLTKAGMVYKAAGTNEKPHWRARKQAYLREALGNPANYQNQSRTITIDATDENQNKKIRVELTATTEPWELHVGQGNTHWSGESWMWSNMNWTDVQDVQYTDTNWSVGDKFTIVEYNATNAYWDGDEPVGNQFVIAGRGEAGTVDVQFNADRFFEGASQFADISFYDGVEKSNASSPEHTITYVNESLENETIPTYEKMSIAGLALKASRNFSSLDQIRFWLSEGLPVKRWHPDLTKAYGDSYTSGPSNLLTDLVYYLLTDKTAGLGNTFNPSVYNDSLINTADLADTAKFLWENKLFFDGAISQAVNVREFIAEIAPNFLCNFVISNGKFSLKPALPTTSGGDIETGAVVIKQLFTSGNILENSFKLNYLEAEERKPFKAVVQFKELEKNQLPEERSVIVRWKEGTNNEPIESFDLTSFCTSLQHAELVAKFFLSIRRRVTHSVEFSTVVDDLILAPGDYIKVITESNPYSSAKNGTINASGVITSASTLLEGDYPISYYKTGSQDVKEATMTVLTGGVIADSALFSSVFTVRDVLNSSNVYLVEQLTINEDNTVQITASEFPCDDNLSSLMAKDVTSDNFLIEGNF